MDKEPTISFYANCNDDEDERSRRRPPHAEFVIRWFRRCPEVRRKSVVRLTFDSHCDGTSRNMVSTPPPAPKKSGSFSRKMSNDSKNPFSSMSCS